MSIPIRVLRVRAGAMGHPVWREPEALYLLVPDHIPAPNTADRVRNQALMRIFRVSLGLAPRPPRLLPLGTCAGREGHAHDDRRCSSALMAQTVVYRILVKRLRTDTDSFVERVLLKTFQNRRVSSPAPVTMASPSGDMARYRTR